MNDRTRNDIFTLDTCHPSESPSHGMNVSPMFHVLETWFANSFVNSAWSGIFLRHWSSWVDWMGQQLVELSLACLVCYAPGAALSCAKKVFPRCCVHARSPCSRTCQPPKLCATFILYKTLPSSYWTIQTKSLLLPGPGSNKSKHWRAGQQSASQCEVIFTFHMLNSASFSPWIETGNVCEIASKTKADWWQWQKSHLSFLERFLHFQAHFTSSPSNHPVGFSTPPWHRQNRKNTGILFP